MGMGRMFSASSFAKRFWGKVLRTGDCWLWVGARNPKDYGKLGLYGKTLASHRVSYELSFGPIPDGLAVLHKCDNPPCVRPDHLFLGTLKDNSQDCLAKGRNKFDLSALCAGRTKQNENLKTCKLGHEYGVTRYPDGRPRRYCPTCSRERHHKDKAKTLEKVPA